MGKVRCWIITIFSPWTHLQVCPPVFSFDFAALLCFPISVSRQRGFCFSALSLCRSSLLSQAEVLGVSCLSWMLLCPLHYRGCLFKGRQQLWFPVLLSPGAVGSLAPYIRRRKRWCRLVLGFLCEPASLQLSHTWVLCSSSYGTHYLLSELYFPLVQVFLSHLSAVPTLWRLLGSCPRMCCSPLGCGFSIAWHYPPPRQSFG